MSILTRRRACSGFAPFELPPSACCTSCSTLFLINKNLESITEAIKMKLTLLAVVATSVAAFQAPQAPKIDLGKVSEARQSSKNRPRQLIPSGHNNNNFSKPRPHFVTGCPGRCCGGSSCLWHRRPRLCR